ncbi:cytochrome bd-I oxidase subunit CydX [Paraburkholderia sp. RL17-383-BIF-A]|jgi:cyd operon protein YbgT|nr:cytochrome bd-I oxidase subunit CydX [Burkholderia sp. WP9]SEC15249.1 cyd operon protein YbgT [Burkholderia sp. WP9]
MWYFSWILGIGVALSFGIVNALWLESRQPVQEAKRPEQRRT